jgi:hypothetical protein
MEKTLLEESILLKEEQFYSKKFYFSYSSLKQLMWNPAIFYNCYILGNKIEKTESHLVQGKLIHCLLLQEKKFNEQFLIFPTNIPTENTKQLLESLLKHHKELKLSGDDRERLEEYSNAILDILKDRNLHQSLKTDVQRIEKIITNDSVIYWEFLKNKESKTIISQEEYEYCKNAVDILKSDVKIKELLAIDVTDFDNIDVFNELFLQIDGVSKHSFGIKGILDNIVINHNNKSININDIKTTSKDIVNFPESVEFYSYWLQAIFYYALVQNQWNDLLLKEYKLNFNFLVIDKTFLYYKFNVSDVTMQDWLNRTLEYFNKAQYHLDKKDFTLPYSLATNSVVL